VAKLAGMILEPGPLDEDAVQAIVRSSPAFAREVSTPYGFS
jgi:hypothetical protein